jgi:hypothetical protein
MFCIVRRVTNKTIQETRKISLHQKDRKISLFKCTYVQTRVKQEMIIKKNSVTHFKNHLK